jgi:hypothetical protein
LNDKGQVFAIITQRQLTNALTNFKIGLNDKITRAIIKDFKKLKESDPIKYLSKGFTRHQYILVETESGQWSVATHKDLLDHFLKQQNK